MSAEIVLFDLGNVVVDWRPILLYEKLFDDPGEAQRFCSEICTLAWHTEHDRGVSMDENAKPLIAKYPEYERHIRTWKTGWLDMFAGYIAGTPKLIATLEEQRVPLYGLSNIPAEKAAETFDAFPIIKVLRDVVVSGVEKVVKPDPKIYAIALERMGHPDPTGVLFIDDSRPNIDAAKALGFQTHHFQGAKCLEADLSKRGLI
ncbi:MAG: HAD-IA family hydrolase [Pseudomonadota bacterium]